MFKLTVLLAFTLSLTAMIMAQQPSFAVASDPDKPKAKRYWSFSGESGVQNQYEADNKFTLIPGATVYLTANYQSIVRKKMAIRLSTTGAVANADQTQGLFAFNGGVKYRKSLRTSFEASNQFVFTPEHRYGKLSGEVNYILGDTEKQIGLFSKAGFYYPLGSELPRYHTHTGLTGFVGTRGILEKPFWEGETELALIADTGSIIKGRRLLASGDIFIALKLGHLRIGPRFGYWQKIAGEFERPNSFTYGLSIALK